MNRKLAALASYCEFHARQGAPLGGLLVTMQPAGRMAKTRPQRTVTLPAERRRPRVLSVGEVQAILDGCAHLRDRLLFATLLDTGVRLARR